VMSVAERAFPSEQGEGSVYLDGASHMLEQAHAQDLERLRSLFRTFEEKGRLVKILNACISDEGVRIYIGHENPDPDLRDLSVITAGYPLEGDASFGVGVLGSTRMEYARVISVVDSVARALTEALRGLRA